MYQKCFFNIEVGIDWSSVEKEGLLDVLIGSEFNLCCFYEQGFSKKNW